MSVAVLAVAMAAAVPKLTEEALFSDVGREQGVSPRLLQAIAVVETGYGGRPWPWTLNIEGTALRFQSQEAAHGVLVAALKRGIRSIDVGYMQVNVAWHGHRLGNTWAALDPHRNITVAAQILRENLDQARDARLAVARYHSATSWRGESYLAKVARVYASISEESR